MWWARLRDVSIRTKLLSAMGAVVFAFGLFGVYLIGTLAITRQSLRVLEQRFEVLRLLSSLEADGQALLSAMRAVIATNDLSWEDVYDEKRAAMNQHVARLGQVVTDAEGRELLAGYEDVMRALHGAELLIVARAAEGNTARAREVFETVYEERHAKASLVVSQAVALERTQVAETIAQTNRLLRSVQIIFWSTMALVLAGVTGLLTGLMRHITQSVERLLAAAQAISGGDLRPRVARLSRDEFGLIGLHFNRMARNLQRILLARDRQRKQLLVQNYELEQTKLRLEDAVKHLQQIDTAKSDFVSVAAHQLRTPLTGIKWTLHALNQEAAQNLTPQQGMLVHDAARATDRLVALVNDLLNVARLEEGRTAVNRVRQPLMPLLVEAVARCAVAAREKEIKVVKRLPAALPETAVDGDRLASVLDNLLDNAIKYTPPGGTVTIEARASEGEVTVQVTDTGIGIPQDDQSQVFTKFFRSENAQLSKTSGTGLGLFMAKKVIEQHGGRMWFHSVENEGSAFSFALPLA